MTTSDTIRKRATWKRILGRICIGLEAVFFLIQLVPYGRNHTNPPVRQEPRWNTPETRELARRACFDCHSNETRWPWYSHVAPVSWLVQHDVDEGREHLNFSEWDRPQDDAGEASEVVREKEMPPWFYLPTHPGANLSAQAREQLAAGFDAMFGRHKEKEEHGRD